MKKLLSGLLLAVFALLLPLQSVFADVWVNGYTRKDGTYVQGHYRSSPDGNPYNNWSYPGNTNPYTGVTAGGSESSYLQNYYDSSGSTYTPSYSLSSISSCPANSYESGSSCKCTYGYVVQNGSCVSGDRVCQAELGLMSSYDSLEKTCKCDYGYVIGSSGRCVYKSLYSDSSKYRNSSSYSAQYSCPTNSSVSASDRSKCTCDTGYEVNKAKTKCVKVSPKKNDKLCQADFGKNSRWDKKYDTDGSPYCTCKDKYEWNTTATSCVKEK